MLFKILRGNEKNLPQTLTDGYCYFLKDKHYFYVDYKDSTGALVRCKLSAEYADLLRYIDTDGKTIELNPADLATKEYIQQQLDSFATIDYVENRLDNITSGVSYDEVTGDLTIGVVSTTYFDATTGNLTIQ
jgi:hypothetical protein